MKEMLIEFAYIFLVLAKGSEDVVDKIRDTHLKLNVFHCNDTV
jgi:hypothetical protein